MCSSTSAAIPQAVRGRLRFAMTSRRPNRRALLPMLALVVALSGCASSRSGASTATGVSASADASAPSTAAAVGSAPALAAQAAQGEIGRNGSSAWSITSQGVYVSADAGRTFNKLPLPPNVPPAAVTGVASNADGHTWLAVSGPGPSVTVYAGNSAAALWSQGVQLTPSWPPNLGGAENQPGGASIASGAPGQVLVLSQLQLTHSVAIPRFVVSTDSASPTRSG